MSTRYTIKHFEADYPNDDACLDKLYSLRFGNLKRCQKCNCKKSYRRLKGRKCYYCPNCYNQVYPMAGTIFEGSSTSLKSWFFAMFLFSTSKNGFSAAELQRTIGVTYKCAWRMLHQIRKLVAQKESLLEGVFEVDETFVGGKNRNRHLDKKIEKSGGRNPKDKVAVLGILQRGGEVRTLVLKKTRARYILPFIRQNIKPGSVIQSDEFRAYNDLSRDYTHKAVDHSKGQYVSEGVTTNRIENFWSIYKRSLKGSYVHVSRKYLQAYSDEITFRFNNRDNRGIFNTLVDRLIDYVPKEPVVEEIDRGFFLFRPEH